MTKIKRHVYVNASPIWAGEARKQMAILNKSRMHYRKGNGVVSLPFYSKFI